MTPHLPVAVFFTTALSRPLLPATLGRLLRPLGPAAVEQALANLAQLRHHYPQLAVVSVRELFAGLESKMRTEALGLFQTENRLDQSFNANAGTGPRNRRLRVRWAGVFPTKFHPGNLVWWFEQMRAMQKIAASLIREGLAISPSHIVISARQGDFMTITASDTDKRRLQVYSQTPLVTRRGSGLVYFGDPNFSPSSETGSHWHLHQTLHAGQSGFWSHVLHFHHAGLRDAAVAGQTLKLGNLAIPCVAQVAYGSALQGVTLAKALLHWRTQVASVAGHGTWFIGHSLPAAHQKAKNTVQRFSLTKSFCR